MIHTTLFRFIDLSVDPGLKSHLHLLKLLFNHGTINTLMILTMKRSTSYLKASRWLMINRSLERSRFKVASDYLYTSRLAARYARWTSSPFGDPPGALPRAFQRSSFMHSVHIFFDLSYAPVKKTWIPECPLVFWITPFYFEILIARSTFATQF
jgi:hypothetical protein